MTRALQAKQSWQHVFAKVSSMHIGNQLLSMHCSVNAFEHCNVNLAV